MLIKYQTNWVWASLPLLWQWKCFVWESCANYTHRRSRRDKSAPGCPKSSCFSPQKYARGALGMARVSERVLEQIVYGHSPEQSPPSGEWLWSQHRELHQQDRQLKMWECSALLCFPQQGQDSAGFSSNHHSASLAFWREKDCFLKNQTLKHGMRDLRLITTFRRIINAQPCEAALSCTFIWGFFTSIMENYALDSSQSCRGIQGT